MLARKWPDVGDDASYMYPTEMQHLSTWEIEHCPWWIDMDKGHVLGQEKEEFTLHGRERESKREERQRGNCSSIFDGFAEFYSKCMFGENILICC